MKVLETHTLGKVYPGAIALQKFSARFEGGKVHAIIGKNGSGKSTLIKIVSGAITANTGSVYVDGVKASHTNPMEAIESGIATVYQELSLIPNMSVAENIFLGRLPKRRRSKIRIDWKETYKRAEDLLKSMGVEIPVTIKVRQLSVGQQQVVEIAKAMSFEPSVLMLDEPSSALAKHEVTKLFSLIRKLRSAGVVILYISHRLQELDEIADTVTVLRDGQFIGRINIAEANPDRIVKMMFGEVKQKLRPKDLTISEENIFQADGLSRKAVFKDVNFHIRKGEILGIAGMLGSGRTELLRAIFGADPLDSGRILFDGQAISHPNPRLMKSLGMAFTPENRKEEGLVLGLSTERNLCMASMNSIAKRGYISKKLEYPYIQHQIKKLEIKVPNAAMKVSSLSGGNQQKVLVGNWLNTQPKLMLYDEPSRGIDVNAKQQIFQIMWELSREGISSLFVSTELEELLEVCHRILIMRHGCIIDEVFPENIRLDELYSLCMES